MAGQYDTLEQAMAGLIAEGIEGKRSIKSRANQDANGINFGAPAMGYIGDEVECYPMILDTAKIVFDGDFGATDAVSFTINGATSATVTYATSHANTMDLIVAALAAMTGVDVYEADATEDSDNRTLYVRTKGVTCACTMADEGGTPPAETITSETDQIFLGIAAYSAKNLSTAGSAMYERYEDVNILEYGNIWALAVADIEALQALYMNVTAGSDLGKQTATAGKTVATVAKSDDITVQTSTVLAKVEVKGQYKLYSEKTWV